MEPSDKKIPNFVLEDLLFQRRLERDLSDELERLNRLLAEQVELLQTRKELLCEVHAAVLQRSTDEDDAVQESANSTTEETSR